MTKLHDVLKSVKEDALSPQLCLVAKWLNTLTKEEAEEFLACMAAPKLSASGLYNTLVDQGIQLPFKLTIFRMHVGGYCPCQK